MTDAKSKPLVAVLMGSASDWETMQHCAKMLDELGVPHDCQAISAHRNPEKLHSYIRDAEKNGVKVFIGAAGGAAHLPGVIASLTAHPVLGVPMVAWSLDGLDSLLSIAQMPAGIPVGTLAIGKAGAKNAAILATQILAVGDEKYARAIAAMRKKQSETVQELPNK